MSEIFLFVQDLFMGYIPEDTLLLQLLELIKLSTASIILIIVVKYILNIIMILITKFVGVTR